ncbi:MAG: maleylacetate reductase, partial [Actinomycetota bacterium]|nr:maleylacetate reductase [Actinomycetota bacterium]
MTSFSYDALPMRVRFGPGSVRMLAEEIIHLGLRRVLVLCSPE